MRWRQGLTLIGGAAALAAPSLSACSEAPTSHAAPESGNLAAEAAGALRALDFAPIAFFNRACARCHGENGEHYGEGFAQGYDDHELREIVKEMVFGPAMARLDEPSVEALVAYHRALAQGEPFLALTRAASDELAGEVSPGASVHAVLQGGRSLDARVDGHNWSIRRPEAVEDLRAVVRALRAVRADKATSLDLRKGAYSHAAATDAHGGQAK